MSDILIRKAKPADVPGILALLRDADLPTEGVADHVEHFLTAENGGQLLGAIGFERYGNEALLRSAVVHTEYRSEGIGGRLYDALRDQARLMQIRRFILLTTTAEKYFRARGFVSIDRAGITGPMARSVEFTTACPSTAVCMELVL